SPFDSAYACSKAALLRLTDSAASAAKSHSVYVFAVSPGTVRTRMNEAMWSAMERGETMTGMRPLEPKDWSPPELAADLVALLAWGRADAFTGRYIHARKDDVRALIQRAADIEIADLQALRLRR